MFIYIANIDELFPICSSADNVYAEAIGRSLMAVRSFGFIMYVPLRIKVACNSGFHAAFQIWSSQNNDENELVCI